MSRSIAINLLLLVLYPLGGMLALNFSLPPGYAMTVFPSAGLALAALLLGGWRMIPGIWLGSVIFNAAVTPGHPDFGNWLPYSIATGSALQAWVAASLIRHFDPEFPAFRSQRSLTVFVLVPSCACLLASAVGSLSLFHAGLIDAGELPANGFSWWLGDLLGCLIFGLMIVVLLREWPRPGLRARIAATGFLLSYALCYAVFWHEKKAVHRDIQEHLCRYAEAQISEVSRILGAHASALQAGQASLRQTALQHSDFDNFCRSSMPYPNAFHSIQFAPVLDAGEWPMRQAQAAEFYHRPVLLRSPSGELCAPQNGMSPVLYLHPFSGNEPSLGLALHVDRELAKILERAQKSGLTSSTRLQASQDPDRPGGLTIILPVHKDERPLGFLLALFDLRIFHSLLIGRESESIHWSLQDPEGNRRLSSKGFPLEESLECRRPLLLFDQNWTLSFRLDPRQAEVAAQNRPLLLLTLLVCSGLCISLLWATRQLEKPAS
ncbi:MAG: hypothetical protein RL095_1318 [Verrucomicrobiota bacterium]|jgi:CHASE1-domain containing sensor protein